MGNRKNASKRVKVSKTETERNKQLTDLNTDLQGPSRGSRSKTAKAKAVPSTSKAAPLGADSSSSISPFEDLLKNHLIVLEIFKYLSVSVLLDLSVVNHFFNSISYTFLRDHKVCLVSISTNRICSELKKLDTYFGSTVNSPFNGFSFYTWTTWWSSRQKCTHKDTTSPDQLSFKNQDPVKFYAKSNLRKYFSCKFVKFNVWIGFEEACPGQIILKEIIKDSASTTLEGIYIQGFNYEKDDHIQTIHSYLNSEDVNSFCLPKLKSVEMPSELDCSRDEAFIKELLRSAPNLKTIRGGISAKFVDFCIFENKVSAVREFSFRGDDYYGEDYGEDIDRDEDDTDSVETNLKQILKFSHSHPKLTKLRITTMYNIETFCKNSPKWFPILANVLSEILTESCNTLQELTIHHLDLVLLTRLIPELQPFHRVHHLTIKYFQMHSWTFSRLNFSTWFPNLRCITFKYVASTGSYFFPKEWEDFYITAEIKNRESLEVEGMAFPSVTKFIWDGDNGTKRKFARFYLTCEIAKLFPNVTDVTIIKYRKLDTACNALWTAWPALESIAILKMADNDVQACIDHSFTGMTKKQCDIVWDAILDGQEDCTEFIQQFQTRPSIRDLKKLKSLTVEICHSSTECHSKKVNPDEVFITVVTQKCALDFMPDLKFVIKRNKCTPSNPRKQCLFSMEHLQPNAKIITTRGYYKIQPYVSGLMIC